MSPSVSRDQYTALPLVGVLVKIMKLKVGSAPGPDGISVKFLQTFCDEISVPLSLIFNLSMGEGLVPSDRRNANVTPIFKKLQASLINKHTLQTHGVSYQR